MLRNSLGRKVEVMIRVLHGLTFQKNSSQQACYREEGHTRVKSHPRTFNSCLRCHRLQKHSNFKTTVSSELEWRVNQLSDTHHCYRLTVTCWIEPGISEIYRALVARLSPHRRSVWKTVRLRPHLSWREREQLCV